MFAVLYTDGGGASMYAGWLACVPSFMINGGQIVGDFLAKPIGKTKYQCTTVLMIGGALLRGLYPMLALLHNVLVERSNGGNERRHESARDRLLMVSTFFIGWNESVCVSNSGIELLDQQEIGTAVGSELRHLTIESELRMWLIFK
jgi:hypothetical protein